MSLILNGSNGLSDVDGSAATPAIRGTDENTGIFFPAADTIAFAEGGVEVARFDSSGRLGIGTTSPTSLLQVGSTASSNTALTVVSANNTAAQIDLLGDSSATVGINVKYEGNGNFFAISSTSSGTLTERMRIDSSGNVLVGTTSVPNGTSAYGSGFELITNNRAVLKCATNTTTSSILAAWYNPNGLVGSISTNGTATSYTTSSDYRLKENIAPMIGALGVVSQLKPVTYKWKSDGSSGQGFIAHELQAVVPDCVTGEKDAVDAEGKPVYQGIDTSFLVATLTAAIQELKATVDAQALRITALEGTAA